MKNKIYIKFVKNANMWVRTYWDEKGIQKQEWSSDKPKE
jgi:hypothetical protein